MNIFDIFKPATPAPAAPAAPANPGTPATPGNIPTPAAPATAAGPGTDNNGLIPSADPAKKDNSPLDGFSKLWEPESTKTANQQPTALELAKVQEAMGKVDFSKNIQPETLNKISAGGPEAVAALMEYTNQLSRQMMTQSTMIASKLAEQQVASAIEAKLAELPSMVKSQNVAEQLRTANPIFSHPAVKPVIEATRLQLEAKFPNASAAEITKMAQDFVTAMGQSFAPPPVKTPETESVDWDAWINKG